jgi:MscS family membrane protein
MNETINNLGLRKKRRYNTALNLAYHTPPLLVESFVEGLREIAMTHPEVDKEEVYIHLNNLGPSSIDIIFVIFFNTNDWALELKWKEEVITSILELATSLGIQFAYPTTALHIETMPDRKSNISDYKEQLSKAKQRLEQYKQNLKQKYAKPEDSGDLESSDNNY